jgi:hypothetical protein
MSNITLRRAAEQAREALKFFDGASMPPEVRQPLTKTLAALDAALSEPKETFAESLFRRSWEAHRAALAEPDAKREPVAWIVTDKDGKVRKFLTAPLGFGVSELVRFDGDTMSPLYAGDTVTLDYIKEDKA